VPGPLRAFVRYVDAMNRVVGRAVMYMIFVMIGVLLWSSVSKTFFLPSLWTLEMAQFLMVAYYMLGGPYSIQLGSNVRMDLLYGDWSDQKKAWFDAITVFPGYVVVIIQTAFAPRMIIPLAYDSGGVTTSTVTVPLVAALGLGLASSVPGRSVVMDGFGLIAFASLFPIISVLGYAQLVQWRVQRKARKSKKI